MLFLFGFMVLGFKAFLRGRVQDLRLQVGF